jgi:hypothetical protein
LLSYNRREILTLAQLAPWISDNSFANIHPSWG